MSLRGILQGLNEAAVDHVVIGGVAASAHGSARIPNAVDICYEPGPANRERLAALLVRWHSYVRGAPPDLPFVLDARTLLDLSLLTLVTDEGWLDVMDHVNGIGAYDRARKASEVIEVLGLSTRVISLDALIAAQRAAGRHKDKEALLELEALREKRRARGL